MWGKKFREIDNYFLLLGLNRVARKLNIDCAPAMIGWAFDGGRPHPEFDGFVVCEEFQDTLIGKRHALKKR